MCVCVPVWVYTNAHMYLYFYIHMNIYVHIYKPAACQVASVVSDSVRPHGLQPTRLLRPWDFPGKNTGVGCHFLLQCIKVESESEVTQLCLTLSDPMDCSPPGSSIHGIFRATVLEWGAIAFSHIQTYMYLYIYITPGASLVTQMVKNPPVMQDTWDHPWIGKILWRRKRQPTRIFLLRKSHGQKSLAGYSPWHCKEADTTERLTHYKDYVHNV